MLSEENNGVEPKYTRNGKCTACGRYSLLNEWNTCKRCERAKKKRRKSLDIQNYPMMEKDDNNDKESDSYFLM